MVGEKEGKPKPSQQQQHQHVEFDIKSMLSSGEKIIEHHRDIYVTNNRVIATDGKNKYEDILLDAISSIEYTTTRSNIFVQLSIPFILASVAIYIFAAGSSLGTTLLAVGITLLIAFIFINDKKVILKGAGVQMELHHTALTLIPIIRRAAK